MKSKIQSLVVGFCLVGSVACNKVDDMHDATMDIRDDTKGLQRVSDDVAQTSHSLDSNGADLKAILREGGGVPIRENMLKDILSSDRAEPQIADAAIYFQSFEFQQWSGIGVDNLEMRDSLAQAAVNEFYTQVHNCIAKDHDMKTPQPLAENNHKVSCLNAISVSLQQVDSHQEAGVQRWNKSHPSDPPIQTISMFSMIRDSLLARQEIAKGNRHATDYPLYVQEWLQYKDETAILLLQSRYDFFGAMVICELSRISAGILQGGRIFLSHWSVDLSKSGYDDSFLGRLNGYLSDALKTRDLLQTLHITPIMDKGLWWIYHDRNIQLSPADAAVTREKKHAEAVLSQAMQAYEASAGPFTYLETLMSAPVSIGRGLWPLIVD